MLKIPAAHLRLRVQNVLRRAQGGGGLQKHKDFRHVPLLLAKFRENVPEHLRHGRFIARKFPWTQERNIYLLRLPHLCNFFIIRTQDRTRETGASFRGFTGIDKERLPKERNEILSRNVLRSASGRNDAENIHGSIQ